MSSKNDFPDLLDEVLSNAAVRLSDNINAWHWPNGSSDSPTTEANVVAEIYSSFREKFTSTVDYFEAKTARQDSSGRVDILIQAGGNAYAIEVKTVGSRENYLNTLNQLEDIKSFSPDFTKLVFNDEVIEPEVWMCVPKWVVSVLLVFCKTKKAMNKSKIADAESFDFGELWTSESEQFTREQLSKLSRRACKWHDGFVSLKGFYYDVGKRSAYKLKIDEKWQSITARDKNGETLDAGDAFLLVGIRPIE